jgi:hypothetical protein
MACLQGHATGRPVRWRQPRAFAAAHHTSRRTHQGRGRRARRRVGGECRVEVGRPGRLIHHASTSAIRALPVAMIEAPLGTLLMAAPRGPHRLVAGAAPAARRTVGVPAIAGATDREGGRTGTARAKTKRVHRVAALRVPGRRSCAAARARMSWDCPARRCAASVPEDPERQLWVLTCAALAPTLPQLGRRHTRLDPSGAPAAPQPRRSVRDGPGQHHPPTPTTPRPRADSRPDLRGLR